MPRSSPPTPSGRTRRTRGGADRIDAHVGKRVRRRRIYLGWSQEKLAEALGLTFQQVQKYERGTNRVGAGRLYQIGKALGVPVSFFFEGLPKTGDEPPAPDPLAERETMNLVRAYHRLPDARVQRRVFDLLRALARTETPGAADPDR